VKFLEAVVSLVAIGAIVFLEWLAIHKGIDGIALSIAIAAVAGLAGYKLPVAINYIMKDKSRR